jgi:hypothetical protein
MMQDTPVRGFALLIAVILSSVLVSVGLALLDISYKQVLLASTATQSQYAFYNADSALECALYWDQKNNAFDYTSPLGASNIICGNIAVNGYTVTTPSAGVKNTTFVIPCAGSGSAGTVTVQKNSTGETSVFANGYNSCDSTNVKRIERALKATYQGTNNAPQTVSGSLSGSGSLSIPAGVTTVTLTGQGGTGTQHNPHDTWNFSSGTSNYGSVLPVPNSFTSVPTQASFYLPSVDSAYATAVGRQSGSSGSPLVFYGDNVPLWLDNSGSRMGYGPITATYSYTLAYDYTSGVSTTATLNGVTRTWSGGYGGPASPSVQTLSSDGSGQTMSYSIGSGGSLSYSYTY